MAFDPSFGNIGGSRSRVFSEFSIVKLLGSGGFGAVFKAQNNLDKKYYALKITISHQQVGSSGDQLKEVQNLAKIPPHNHIVAYITAWRDSFIKSEVEKLSLDSDLKNDLRSRGQDNGFNGVIIQMELCGLDLRKWLIGHREVNEGRVIGIFEQIVKGLEHLHNHNLIHRDLKPENIFFSYNDPYTVKVGDLGIAADHLGTRSQTHTKGFGTRLYIAPEQESSNSYAKPVDLFSLGLILFELFDPQMQPQNDNNWENLARNFRDLKYQQKLPDHLTKSWPIIAQLIKDLTNYESKSRPEFKDIYKIMDIVKPKVVIDNTKSTSSGNSSGYSSSSRSESPIIRKKIIDQRKIVPIYLGLLKQNIPVEKEKKKMISSPIIPIKLLEHLKLTEFGVDQTYISFDNLTMNSDKFICVREKVYDSDQIVIVDLEEKKFSIKRFKLDGRVDSAILHPVGKLIAIKMDDGTLHIFTVETKIRIKTCQFTENIIFWTWINNKTIGIVTQSAVFNWSIEEKIVPNKLFDLHSSLFGTHIINYRTEFEEKWHLLVSITPQQNQVLGSMQLYSVEKKISQPIEGYAGVLAQIRLEGNSQDSKLLCFVSKNQKEVKLHIVEMGKVLFVNKPFSKKVSKVCFSPEAKTDFPEAMQVSSKYDLLYFITKFGYIHIYDLECGECIYMTLITSETIFMTAQHFSTGGIIGVNMKGQVLSVTIDEETIVPYILNELSNEDLALRLAQKNNFIGAEEIFTRKFNNLLRDAKYLEAAKLASEAPKGFLRTLETIKRFQEIETPAGQTAPLIQYFGILLDLGKLNKYESLELTRPVLLQGKNKLVEKWLKEDKLECSEELGDFVKQFDSKYALSIFLRARIPAKVVQCMAETGRFSRIIPYSKSIKYNPDYIDLLRYIVIKDPEGGIQFAKLLIADEPYTDIKKIVDIFLEQNMIEKCAGLLIDLKIDINTVDSN